MDGLETKPTSDGQWSGQVTRRAAARPNVSLDQHRFILRFRTPRPTPRSSHGGSKGYAEALRLRAAFTLDGPNRPYVTDFAAFTQHLNRGLRFSPRLSHLMLLRTSDVRKSSISTTGRTRAATRGMSPHRAARIFLPGKSDICSPPGVTTRGTSRHRRLRPTGSASSNRREDVGTYRGSRSAGPGRLGDCPCGSDQLGWQGTCTSKTHHMPGKPKGRDAYWSSRPDW